MTIDYHSKAGMDHHRSAIRLNGGALLQTGHSQERRDARIWFAAEKLR